MPQHLKRTKELKKGVYRKGLSRIVKLLKLFDVAADQK